MAIEVYGKIQHCHIQELGSKVQHCSQTNGNVNWPTLPRSFGFDVFFCCEMVQSLITGYLVTK
jgi:hypothetical protein